ncbi:MAG: sulfotransferase domain-containing protein [Ardenticatenaceae bacterium]
MFRKKPKTIIVVSGLPRSGTSMMMKMLEAGGLPVLIDNLRTPDTDNPKGYYEFERVKELPKGDKAWLKEAPGTVVKVISALLQHLPPDYDYKVIFMQRKIEEVLASQHKMLIRRGEPTDRSNDAQMTMLFQKHLQNVKAWLANQPNISVLYTNYNDILADPQPHVAQINGFFDNTLDSHAMLGIVDPGLYRNRNK